MNIDFLFDTIREHLEVMKGVQPFINVVYRQTFYIDDDTYINSHKVFIGCTFVFTNPPAKPLKLFAVCGCTFVYFGEETTKIRLAEYEFGYYIRNMPEPFSCYCPNIIERREARCRVFCRQGTIEVFEAAVQTKKRKQETNESKLQFSYNGKDFSYSTNSFVGGVELEIPVHENSFRMSKVNRRRWLKVTDSSQIEGDLEMISYPANISFFKSENFRKQTRELYAAVGAPDDSTLYTDEYSEKGSGIHIHISWHLQHNLNSSEVRSFYYKELAKRGGEDFCLAVGGKSEPQFAEYSPYKIDHCGGDKYDCVNIVNKNHIELRWLANDPDPDVVCNRVKLAIDIFEVAVVELYKHKIAESTRIHLWTIQPHFKLLPKVPVIQTTPVS